MALRTEERAWGSGRQLPRSTAAQPRVRDATLVWGARGQSSQSRAGQEAWLLTPGPRPLPRGWEGQVPGPLAGPGGACATPIIAGLFPWSPWLLSPGSSARAGAVRDLSRRLLWLDLVAWKRFWTFFLNCIFRVPGRRFVQGPGGVREPLPSGHSSESLSVSRPRGTGAALGLGTLRPLCGAALRTGVLAPGKWPRRPGQPLPLPSWEGRRVCQPSRSPQLSLSSWFISRSQAWLSSKPRCRLHGLEGGFFQQGERRCPGPDSLDQAETRFVSVTGLSRPCPRLCPILLCWSPTSGTLRGSQPRDEGALSERGTRAVAEVSVPSGWLCLPSRPLPSALQDSGSDRLWGGSG